jgi:hypothetical protein
LDRSLVFKAYRLNACPWSESIDQIDLDAHPLLSLTNEHIDRLAAT